MLQGSGQSVIGMRAPPQDCVPGGQQREARPNQALWALVLKFLGNWTYYQGRNPYTRPHPGSTSKTGVITLDISH